MSVTAKQLSNSGARGKDLDAVVREHLQIIDDKLLRADRKWGWNVVTYDLPVQFSVPGLEKKDAQRIIYSTILRSLLKRGFELSLLLEPDLTTVAIGWMTDLDVNEVEAMNAVIRAKRIERAAFGEFIKKGALPAPRAVTAAREGRGQPATPLKLGEGAVMNPRGGTAPGGSADVRQTPAAASTAEQQLLAAGAQK